MANIRYSYSSPFPMGNNYVQPEPIKMDNMLTSEDMKTLSQENATHFVSNISKSEIVATRCTHKKNGTFALQDVGNGMYRCTVCGETFHVENPTELDIDTVREDCQKVIDHLQTVKTFFTDIVKNPQDIELFKSIPIIKRIPEMIEATRSNYYRLDMFSSNPYEDADRMGGPSSAQMMDAIMGNFPMGGGNPWGYYGPNQGPQWGGNPWGGYGPQWPTRDQQNEWNQNGGYGAAGPWGGAWPNRNAPQNGQNNAQAQQNGQAPQTPYSGNSNFRPASGEAQSVPVYTSRNPAAPNPNYGQAPNPIGSVVPAPSAEMKG